MLRLVFHACIIAVLTALTQLGGIAWALSRLFRYPLPLFALLYTGLSLAAIWLAPLTGRTALSCFERGPLQVQSWFYCATNRTYVTPELKTVLEEAAERVREDYPGTQTLVLDANFPFLTGFPLLPHLSHDDGEKVDLAFYYADAEGLFFPNQVRSPIGYFAFEDGPTNCPDTLLSLRWDLDWLQSLWKTFELEPQRNRLLVATLARDPRVAKIFIEPHLKQSLGLSSDKIRFQGCRAARHDDHIHLQL
ncbi:hypothetical protein [Pseudophaeobacter sp.]|uniref:hypothetical protein n=1 Tax=Pseudophaeobacter sp. TaxID=1971739 RepID=UPI00329A5951